VANLPGAEGERYMALAAKLPLRTEVHRYPLERANDALADVRAGRFSGAAVLIP
jgi:propanol-preferring alcohol dehydrogenase